MINLFHIEYSRRRVVTAAYAAIGVSFAGCLGDSDDGNATDLETNDADENGGNKQNAVECSFRVVLVDDPPDEATIVSANDESLDDVTVIQEILRKATDSESEFQMEEFESGEHRVFHYDSFTRAEYEEASTVLEGIPTYDGDDGPFGNYVEHPDQTVAITEDCLT